MATNGTFVDLSLYYGGSSNYREIVLFYKPCMPRFKNETDTGKCIVEGKDDESYEKKFKESKNYVGEAQFVMLYNTEYFEAKKFGVNTTSRVSKVKQRQFSSGVSAFSVTNVNIGDIEDETSFINLG